MSLSPSSVQRVCVISTGWGKAHPEHLYGTKKPTLWWIFRSKEWVRVPVNVFVIEHADGVVLFDTGVDRAPATDPDYWPDRVTRFFMHHIFDWEIGPHDTLTDRLAEAGYSTNEVSTAVLSHLQMDHGGLGPHVGPVPGTRSRIAPRHSHPRCKVAAYRLPTHR